jgi:hypothetical protein
MYYANWLLTSDQQRLIFPLGDKGQQRVKKKPQMNVREIADFVRRPHETTKTVIDRIRSWADYGILRPVGEKHPGTGKKRRYGPETIVDATLLTAITDLGLAAVRVGHFSGDDSSIIDLCRTAALTVLGGNEQRDTDWMLIISPPSPETGRSSARFDYEVGRPSTERDHWIDVPMPSILEGAIVLNLTKIFKPLRSILEVIQPEPPGFPFPGFRLKENTE